MECCSGFFLVYSFNPFGGERFIGPVSLLFNPPIESGRSSPTRAPDVLATSSFVAVVFFSLPMNRFSEGVNRVHSYGVRKNARNLIETLKKVDNLKRVVLGAVQFSTDSFVDCTPIRGEQMRVCREIRAYIMQIRRRPVRSCSGAHPTSFGTHGERSKMTDRRGRSCRQRYLSRALSARSIVARRVVAACPGRVHRPAIESWSEPARRAIRLR